MKVAYTSDVHYDIWFNHTRDIPKFTNDCDADVLILAGDIFEYRYWNDKFHGNILKLLCDRFKHVIMVDGNHEFYGTTFESDHPYVVYKNAPKNFHYLRNESITIDNVTFFGGTFWTNPQNWSPIEQQDVKTFINDFTYIKDMTFESMTVSHDDFLNSLYGSQLMNDNDIVVISHFPPSELSISEKYRGWTTNAYFCNRLFDELYDNKRFKHWVCGHVHHVHEFEIGNIKGHCNPVGYPNENQSYSLKYFEV